MALKRFVDGITKEPFFQKRAPDNTPDWIRTAELTFPSGRTADEIVVDEAALIWVVNLGCIDLNPHPVRADDLDHPDELRVDLDPVPGIEWPQIRDVAMACRLAGGRRAGRLAQDLRLTQHPHQRARRAPLDVPRGEACRLALARDVERRMPGKATSKWWKERQGVFLDYNQNAKDRTVASAYSVRPLPDAQVSMPMSWDEVPTCEPRRSRSPRCRRGLPRSATRAPGSTTPSAPGCPPRTVGEARGGRRGRRAVAAEPPKQAVSRRGSSRPASAGPIPSTRADGARQAGRHRRSPQSGRRPWRRAIRPGLPTEWEGSRPTPTGRRRTTVPVIEISRAASKAEALEGFDRWKSRHPKAAEALEPRTSWSTGCEAARRCGIGSG